MYRAGLTGLMPFFLVLIIIIIIINNIIVALADELSLSGGNVTLSITSILHNMLLNHTQPTAVQVKSPPRVHTCQPTNFLTCLPFSIWC